ncbi:MAG: HAMP domain-containing protein, partial [Pseudomonadota bacterium]
MRWPKRIGTKLGLVFAGLFALTMLLIAAALHMVVTERATVTVADEMTASGAVFSRLFLDKAADKQADAQLLAKDFGFRAAATSADPPTIASALENLAIRLGTTSLALIDTDGMVLGAVGKRLPLDKLTAHLDLSDDAALVDNKTGVLFAQDTPYLAGVAEVRAPNLVSWIVFGDEITSQKIAELNALSALNFNARLQLVDRNSLPPSTARQVGQDIVFARLAPSLLDTQRSQLVLTYPIADALRPYRSLAGVLLIVMLGCGAGVAGISWVVARRLAQPISDLSIAATALRDGQSAQVVVRSQDELGDLARAFNDMSGEIARREEDLRTQALTDRETGLPNRRAFEHALE